MDSILNNNYRNITNVINREYDTPRLLNDRQIIINRLNQKVNLNNFYLILTLLVSISPIIIAIFQYRKRKTQKLIFEGLLKTSNNTTDISVELVKVKKESVDLPKDIIDDLLDKLSVFEKKKVI